MILQGVQSIQSSLTVLESNYTGLSGTVQMLQQDVETMRHLLAQGHHIRGTAVGADADAAFNLPLSAIEDLGILDSDLGDEETMEKFVSVIEFMVKRYNSDGHKVVVTCSNMYIHLFILFIRIVMDH